MKTNWRAHLALLFVNLFYGLNYSIAKGIMPDFVQPFALTFLRSSIALLLFCLLFLITKNKEKIERKDVIKLVVAGLTGVTFNQLLFLSGLSITSPIDASIIVVCTPVVVVLFSFFMLKEKIGIKKSVGVLLGLAGSVLLILNSTNNANATSSLKGNFLVLCNVFSYSFYLVWVKQLMAKYKPQTVIRWVFFFGLIFVLPFAFKDLAATDWQNIPFNIWLAIGYVALFATFATYLLNIYALKSVNPSLVGFYIYFQILVASTVAIFLGNESLNMVKIISALLIVVAVFLVGNFKFERK